MFDFVTTTNKIIYGMIFIYIIINTFRKPKNIYRRVSNSFESPAMFKFVIVCICFSKSFLGELFLTLQKCFFLKKDRCTRIIQQTFYTFPLICHGLVNIY